MAVIINADRLRALITTIFCRASCDAEEAALIAHNLVEADLAGHESHGVMRTSRYVASLKCGMMHAGRKIRIIQENSAFAVLDGNGGIGQSIAKQAVDFALEHARDTGCFIVALRHAGHVGRIGSWALMAAEAGYVSIHFVNVAGSVVVAPYGGMERQLSTAPFCVGVPRAGGPPVILDFATSFVSEGKVMVAAKGGPPVPDGALIDENGNPTTDPVSVYGDAGPDALPHQRVGTGAIRTFGGHKGSGLALICELLGGALTGNGTAGIPTPKLTNGMLSIYISVDAMDDSGGFDADVSQYLESLANSRPIDPQQPVLIPGDPERARARKRRADGISLPEEAWNNIKQTASDVGVRADELAQLAGL